MQNFIERCNCISALMVFTHSANWHLLAGSVDVSMGGACNVHRLGWDPSQITSQSVNLVNRRRSLSQHSPSAHRILAWPATGPRITSSYRSLAWVALKRTASSVEDRRISVIGVVAVNGNIILWIWSKSSQAMIGVNLAYDFPTESQCQLLLVPTILLSTLQK